MTPAELMTAIVLLVFWYFGTGIAVGLLMEREDLKAVIVLTGVSKLVTCLGIVGIVWWVIANADLIADYIRSVIHP